MTTNLKNYIIINGALAALLIFEIFLWRFIMKKEFIEPEVEVVEFEVEENVAYIDSEGWIIDPDKPWH